MRPWVLWAGYILLGLCLFVPILSLVPFLIGIVAVVRQRVRAGVVLIVSSVVIAVIGGTLVVPNFVQPYRMPSESMEPTLHIGERFLLWHLAGDPQVGDIVVFNPPVGADSGVCGATGKSYDPEHERRACATPTRQKSSVEFIKRVVAGPGDRVAIAGGHVIRNGKRQKEGFITPCQAGGACDLPKPITVPPDHYFMMGDNRGSSDDSRFWGPVHSDWIKGTAFAVYSPIKDIRGL